MEYLNCCTTTMRACCKKGGHCKRQACSLDIDKAVSLWCILCLVGLRIWHLDKNIIGFHFSSCSWNRTSSMMCSDTLVSTLKFSSLLDRACTSWLVIFSFSLSNVFWYFSSYFQSFLHLSSLRGFTIWLKFLIKHL